MTDDLENLLHRFRPAGPPADLRDKILRQPPAAPASRRWATWTYRSAVAALLLLSFVLVHAANVLNQDSAARVGVGPPRWTPEAEQAADLIDPGPAGRQYIALCLIAGNAPQIPPQGDLR